MIEFATYEEVLEYLDVETIDGQEDKKLKTSTRIANRMVVQYLGIKDDNILEPDEVDSLSDSVCILTESLYNRKQGLDTFKDVDVSYKYKSGIPEEVKYILDGIKSRIAKIKQPSRPSVRFY